MPNFGVCHWQANCFSRNLSMRCAKGERGMPPDGPYDGFRMVATTSAARSRSRAADRPQPHQVAKALEMVNGDAVTDGELAALDANGVSHLAERAPQ